jgi:asparaginyl-tRNA synthetase
LNDGTYFENLQVIVSKALENFDEVSKYSIASAIEVQGKLVETPNMKQPFELQASNVVLLADSDSDYPLQNKRHTFEYLREIAHLRPRSNTFSAVFRVRSLAAHAIHEFFQNRGYFYAHTPIITGSERKY